VNKALQGEGEGEKRRDWEGDFFTPPPPLGEPCYNRLVLYKNEARYYSVKGISKNLFKEGNT